MSKFKTTNLAQVCDNCGGRHPKERSCVKFWQDNYMKKLSEVVNYMQLEKQLYKDNGLMKDTLKTIRDMTLDVTDNKNFVRDAETIKALVKTILAVVE